MAAPPYNSYRRSPYSSHQTLASFLLLLLTALPLSLAAFAFFLQWRGDLNDPTTRWSPNKLKFPVMGIPPPTNITRSADILGRSSSPSFPYYRDWKFNIESDMNPKICITTSTSGGLEQILPWIFYHKVIGVSTFFLFVEGKAASPNVSVVLESVHGVKVIYRTKELEEQQARSRIWNETWLARFFHKPCNSVLFVKQTLNMEMAIVMARDAGMDWIVHIDTDELIHPARASGYSLRELLLDVPQNVDMVVFLNYESTVERDDIKEPFSEVYFSMYKESLYGNPNFFLAYANGKSAARIQDHLRPNGAHRWYNYKKTPNVTELKEAVVLHYVYTKFSELASRRDRCGCKPTEEDVKRCFILNFDRAAFIIASIATEEEMLRWYREHVVWNDEKLKLKLLRAGIMTRIYAPMVIVQGLRESGLFTSVITSAQMTLSKDKFTSAVESSNSSGTIEIEALSTRKIGRSREYQATTRKVLGNADNLSHEEAIPPLSPPGMNGSDV